MTTVTLENIRAAAERLATAHLATSARASLMQEQIKEAVTPIYDRHRSSLDSAAEEEAAANAELQSLLDASPHLFIKPRSLSVNGVRAGFRKQDDTLNWPDDGVVIARIKALIPEQADLLIRSQESLVVDAVANLDSKTLRAIGVSQVSGVDQSYITVGDSDIEKLAKTLIADAIRRQGEEEPKKAKKSKASVKAKETA